MRLPLVFLTLRICRRETGIYQDKQYCKRPDAVDQLRLCVCVCVCVYMYNNQLVDVGSD